MLVGETVPEQLTLALDLEKAAIDRLNAGIARCVSTGDNGTRDLLAGILHGEEEHADWLETQLSAIDDVGVQLYLAEQLGRVDEARRGPSGPPSAARQEREVI